MVDANYLIYLQFALLLATPHHKVPFEIYNFLTEDIIKIQFQWHHSIPRQILCQVYIRVVGTCRDFRGIVNEMRYAQM